jgi:hypothetical protein
MSKSSFEHSQQSLHKIDQFLVKAAATPRKLTIIVILSYGVTAVFAPKGRDRQVDKRTSQPTTGDRSISWHHLV